jgi:hypothetical protein
VHLATVYSDPIPLDAVDPRDVDVQKVRIRLGAFKHRDTPRNRDTDLPSIDGKSCSSPSPNASPGHGHSVAEPVLRQIEKPWPGIRLQQPDDAAPAKAQSGEAETVRADRVHKLLDEPFLHMRI